MYLEASGDRLWWRADEIFRPQIFFAAFADHFAQTAAPLYDVLKNESTKKRRQGVLLNILHSNQRWGSPQRRAWREQKDELSDSCILVAPIRERPERVMTETGTYWLGAVLLQLEKEDKWAVVSFLSRVFKKAERNYAPPKQKCLAVGHRMRKWRPYLHGDFSTVVTEHLSLKWMMSLKDPREKLTR